MPDADAAAVPAWEPAAAALAAIAAMARDGGIAIGHDAHAALDLHAAADRDGLAQLLTMLLSSAVLGTPAGGQVVLLATRAGERHLRYVVYAPAYRELPQAAQPLAERTGAVLDAGRPLAVSVPVAPAPSPARPPEPAPVASEPPEDGAPRRVTVLCIEDNPSHARLIAAILERRPHVELLHAQTASAGLQLARDVRPALLILDLHLADRSGMEVLDELRADAATARMPVVVLSAEVLPGRLAEFAGDEATEFLAKPLDVRELLAVVDRRVAPS